jgi:hypothetical protein
LHTLESAGCADSPQVVRVGDRLFFGLVGWSCYLLNYDLNS